MNPITYVFFSIFLVAGSQLLFKRGTLRIARKEIETNGLFKRILVMLFHKDILTGILLNGVAAFFWLIALSNFELSYIFPYLSLNYILIPLLATIVFKEYLSNFRIAGIAVICTGLFLIALS